MPYIEQIKRDKIDYNLDKIIPSFWESEGTLNYAITKLCLGYLQQHGVRYSTLNTVIGVLECAKLEMARRQLFPYEDNKIETNGDIQ